MDRFTLAKRLAEEGGAICLKWFGKENMVKNKSETDVVTSADLEAEKHILSEIRKYFPDDAILSEEAGETGKKSKIRWIIDPLDGTVNFAAGLPYFACTIGIEENGVMIAAAVFDPITNDLYTAEHGKGAFMNDKRLSVSTNNNLRKSIVSSMSRWNNGPDLERGVREFGNILRHCRTLRIRGCSMLDLCFVANGALDGFLKVNGSYEDFATGALIVEEAGGRVTDDHGNPWGTGTKSIVASNGKLHAALLKALVA
jgi:myo-inositol-1(or 4)-monophosphatase